MNHSPTRAEIVLASRNRKKAAEMAELLAPRGIGVKSIAEFPDAPEIVEDGHTFAENAAKKAGQTARALGRWTIGEDSGLVVDALDGQPGIYSARYAGETAADAQNNEKLIQALARVPADQRTARYICSIAVADPNGAIQLQQEASCSGRITSEARGSNGFGYDPHFLIPEYHRTFGELDPAVKRHISHRARAFERLIPRLVALLQSQVTT